MKSLKTRLVAGIGAAAIMMSVPLSASASWFDPDVLDLDAAIANIVGNTTKLLATAIVKAEDIKVVNVEDVADAKDLFDIKNTLNNLFLKLQLITLKNTLNNIDVLNGNQILNFSDFLNKNDVDISDVIAVNVFRDGKIVVWSCDSCK